MHTSPRPTATVKTHKAGSPGAVPRIGPAANQPDCRGAVKRFLFGTPGDFLDRHQGVVFALVIAVIMVGSGL